jgi:8-oxo-dGTP diphosphatase
MRGSREGELQWFSLRKIPYREMWEDDNLWLPLLFAGERFIGDFFFTEEYNKLIEHKIILVR